jgi:beta-N-acetylglucosaminidase
MEKIEKEGNLEEDSSQREDTAESIDDTSDLAESESEENLQQGNDDLQNQENEVETFSLDGARSTSAQYLVNFNKTNNSSTYVSYTEYSTGKSGYINGTYGADAAYLGTTGNYYIFMMSGVIGKVKSSDVTLVALSNVKSYSYYYVSGEKLYHRITGNLSQSKYVSNLRYGKAPSYLSQGTNYFSYDGHYFYTNYTTMISDYTSDSRAHSVNSNNPYFNYYQYLPLRSTTSYSASDLNSTINGKISSTSKLKDLGNDFVNNQNTYGVNALLMASIAINESGWGDSSIAKNKNNLFGLNAVDASPSQSANYYSSVSACIKDFAETYMSKKYLNPNGSNYRGAYLGNKASGINVQYASDPYWGEKAANYAYYLGEKLSSKDDKHGKYPTRRISCTQVRPHCPDAVSNPYRNNVRRHP